jgi:tetratricopeptide (TPR) repeat protein
MIGLAAAMSAFIAHAATGSRGGRAGLLVGIGVAAAGVTLGMRRRNPARSAWGRWAPVALGIVLVCASVVSLRSWAASDGALPNVAADGVDPSLGSRLAVATEGRQILRDFPAFGTGLGTWLHAFRPYQAPPVEGGIWDHAHNDYVELAAEIGMLGLACVIFFAVTVAAAARRQRDPESRALARREHDQRPPGFETSEWRAALKELPFVRWGLAGGVAAILVHSVVDFSLRMPANLILLMAILALLVLRGRPQPAGRTPVAAALLAVLLLAIAPVFANTALQIAGAVPLSPADALDRADLTLGEEGHRARDDAVALVRRALDWSPADRSAHEQLATVLGAGREGDDALRRAIALNPWAPEVRDELALSLWEQGDRAGAARELEESIYRFPYLVSHAYLSPDGTELVPRDTGQIIRALADGDTMTVRLSALPGEMADAIQRGLERALDRIDVTDERVGVVDDLVLLLEVRGRWTDAASVLHAEAERTVEGGEYYARAARDFLKARDQANAEKALLAALERTPEQGNLYRDLAVKVYAERGDFDIADAVLEAGERNAVNMMPVYRGTTEVLTRREAARGSDMAGGAVARPAVVMDDGVDAEEDELP